MMTKHLDLESLSAHLDGELDAREKSRVESHLGSCAQCAAARAQLSAVCGSVAALGPVTMTADEHRALRQAVLRARPEAAGRRFAFPRWAFAGALLVVAVSALALSFLRGGPTRSFDAVTEAGVPADGDSAFNFADGKQVDRTVAGLPEVMAGLDRTPSSETHFRQDEAAGSLEGPSSLKAPAQEMAPANPAESGRGEDAAGSPALSGPAAGGTFSDEAGDACLGRVAATQSYAMAPLLAREASFEGRPVWLLVFAWSPDEAGGGLDGWQSWIVDPADCRDLSGPALEAAAAYRGFSPQP